MDFLELKIAVLSQLKFFKYNSSSGTLATLLLPPRLQTFFTTFTMFWKRLLQILIF